MSPFGRPGFSTLTAASGRRSPVRLLVLYLLAALTVGCGGGGSDPPPPPPATLSPTSVSVTVTEGQSGVLQTTVTVGAQVDTSNGVYLRIQRVAVFANVDVIGTSPTTGIVSFYTQTSLPAGEHVGSVDFIVCKASGCAQTYSDTPATLSYRITVTPAPPPPPPPPVPPAAEVTPSTLTTSTEVGDPFEVGLTAQLRVGINAAAFAVEDPLGRFVSTADSSYLGGGPTRYSVTLRGRAIDAVGIYTGSLNLIVCAAAPCSMSTSVPGPPIPLSYTVTVTTPLLQPIPTLTGLPEWETYQGNVEHTGYVPVTLNPARFQSRWSWSSPFGAATAISPVTTGSGLVVFSVTGRFAPAFLVALHEADATRAWQHDFGSLFAVNHPAASAGRVFVATSGHQDTAMWSFDLMTGELRFRTPFQSQWEHYLAPTFRDRTVYTNGGYYGGLYAFRGSNGVRTWYAGLAQYDLWTPAVDEAYAYAHTGYEWVAIDRTTGERAFTVPNTTFNWRGYALNIAPVIDAPGSILVVDGVYDYDTLHDNHLIRYSVSTRGELWRVNGRFASNPAAAGGRVYVLNASSNRLEVYSAADGALLWQWSPPDPADIIPVGNVLVTDSHVFFSTRAATYAIDLDTRQSVWSTPNVGDLALSSNGVLYVVTPQRIHAYDLL